MICACGSIFHDFKANKLKRLPPTDDVTTKPLRNTERFEDNARYPSTRRTGPEGDRRRVETATIDGGRLRQRAAYIIQGVSVSRQRGGLPSDGRSRAPAYFQAASIAGDPVLRRSGGQLLRAGTTTAALSLSKFRRERSSCRLDGTPGRSFFVHNRTAVRRFLCRYGGPFRNDVRRTNTHAPATTL